VLTYRPTRIHHPNAAAALGTPARVVVLTSLTNFIPTSKLNPLIRNEK